MVKVAIALLNSHQELNIITANFKMKGYKKKCKLYDAHIKKYLMKKYKETDGNNFDKYYEYDWRIMDNEIDNIDYDDFIKECEDDIIGEEKDEN